MATSKGGRRAQQQAQRGEPARTVEELIPIGPDDKREAFDRKYKPYFDEHTEKGKPGIPFNVLRETLVSAGNEDLPPRKLNYLLTKADANNDGYIDYEEFYRLMSTGLFKLNKYQTFLNAVVRSAAPGEDEDDYITHYNCMPPPLFMIIISAAEVAVFVGYAVWLNQRGISTTMTAGAPLFSPLTYNPQRRYEAWRYLGYMFIHDGIKHILSNLIFQLLLGIPLEMVHKFWRVGLVYCFGVIAGSLATSVTDPTIFLVGASGGCYALIGAQFAICIMNWKEMTKDWLKGPLLFITSAPVILTFWGLYASVDTGVAIYMRYANPAGSQVAYAAHFAGLIAGVLMGVPILRNFNVLPWENKLWWICLSSFIIAVIVAIFLNAFLPIYPKVDWRSCCPCPCGYFPCPLNNTVPCTK